MSTIFISILLQKNTVWFYLLWIWLEQEILLTLVGRWIERSLQQISIFELVRDLLFFKFFKSFKCSSSPSNVLQVFQMFFKFFKDSWDIISSKLGLLENLVFQNERKCPLFIVVSDDKLHFKLIYLKICSKLLIVPNFF